MWSNSFPSEEAKMALLEELTVFGYVSWVLLHRKWSHWSTCERETLLPVLKLAWCIPGRSGCLCFVCLRKDRTALSTIRDIPASLLWLYWLWSSAWEDGKPVGVNNCSGFLLTARLDQRVEHFCWDCIRMLPHAGGVEAGWACQGQLCPRLLWLSVATWWQKQVVR